MRASWIVVALVACHHSEAPAPAAPKGPTACARAADSMVQTMLARLPAKEAPPTEQADAFRNLIRERCEHDAWSAAATQCLIAIKTTADAEPCAKLMTDEQQAALVRDEQAQFGAPPGASDAQPATDERGAGSRSDASTGAPEPGSPASQAAPGRSAPAPARRSGAGKPKGNGAAGDPCSGGE